MNLYQLQANIQDLEPKEIYAVLWDLNPNATQDEIDQTYESLTK